jgi:hypothetical protein
MVARSAMSIPWLLLANIELKGGGDKARAMKILRSRCMLDRYEENGGKHFGLYRLRANHSSRGKTLKRRRR